MDFMKDYEITKDNLETMAVEPLGTPATMAIDVNNFAKRHPKQSQRAGFRPFKKFTNLSYSAVVKAFKKIR